MDEWQMEELKMEKGVPAVPEPSRALLLMLGLMGVVVRRRRK